MRRIYWDSCIFIYRVQQVKPWCVTIDQHLRSIPAPARLVITDLTRLECRVLPIRTGDDDLLERFDTTFALPSCEQWPCDHTIFNLAIDLRARHNLKTPDALHLAAALVARCDQFWTNDTRLNQAADGRIAIVTFD